MASGEFGKRTTVARCGSSQSTTMEIFPADGRSGELDELKTSSYHLLSPLRLSDKLSRLLKNALIFPRFSSVLTLPEEVPVLSHGKKQTE